MKLAKRLAGLLAIGIIAYAIWYLWQALPIISGYGAKTLCSCTFLSNRDPQDVIANELGSGMLALGAYKIHFADSSATGHVFGLATKKAVYRKGVGCTLLNGIEESELRSQKFDLARTPYVPDTTRWPAGNKLADSLPPVNVARLQEILDDAFSEPGPEPVRRTRAILIIYKGEIVAERYADGFGPESRLLGWSMTKSLTNAMVGLLVRKGMMDVSRPADIAEWSDDKRRNITITHLLHASSGLEWEENYGGPSPATNMLFKERNVGQYASSFPYESEPDTDFEYSSGTTNILSMLVGKATGTEYHRFAYEELFHKIGMTSLVIEPDASGTFVGSSFSWATARDWGRFGLLYLMNGKWKGEQLLPEHWVSFTTQPAPAATQGEYGAQFWLNAGAKGNPENRIYPDAPTDLFWADGYEGQNVFIIPSKDLVIVKLSLSSGNFIDDNKFLADIIEATSGFENQALLLPAL